jgi:hypothetical protein
MWERARDSGSIPMEGPRPCGPQLAVERVDLNTLL